MANSNTEHSKELRRKTAAAHAKKQMELGLMKQITMRAATPIIDDFDAIAAELGLSRPKTLEILCQLYYESKNDAKE